ncbi:hypothetical protein D3C76_535160 [compost metagenome]
MRGIRGQHDPAALSVHPHDLTAGRMPAYRMQGHARNDLDNTVVQTHPPFEQRRQRRHHVLDFVGFVHRAMDHFRPGAETQLRVLQMHGRLGEQPEVAGMIPMQMGKDQVLDPGRIDVQLPQGFFRQAIHLAIAPIRRGRLETGVDHDHLLLVADDPEVVVQRHRRIRITAAGVVEKILPGGALGVCTDTDGEHFVHRRGHKHLRVQATAVVLRVGRKSKSIWSLIPRSWANLCRPL